MVALRIVPDGNPVRLDRVPDGPVVGALLLFGQATPGEWIDAFCPMGRRRQLMAACWLVTRYLLRPGSWGVPAGLIV